MDRTYLQEAFRAMELLEEEDFRLDDVGVKDILDFQDHDEMNDIIDVFDPEAETEEEVKDSYIGSVILECDVCHSPIFKDVSEIDIDEESGLANIEDECPICHSQDGFKIIGQVAPYQEDAEIKVEVEDKPEEDDVEEIDDEEDEEEVEESLKEDLDPELAERLDEIEDKIDEVAEQVCPECDDEEECEGEECDDIDAEDGDVEVDDEEIVDVEDEVEESLNEGHTEKVSIPGGTKNFAVSGKPVDWKNREKQTRYEVLDKNGDVVAKYDSKEDAEADVKDFKKEDKKKNRNSSYTIKEITEALNESEEKVRVSWGKSMYGGYQAQFMDAGKHTGINAKTIADLRTQLDDRFGKGNWEATEKFDNDEGATGRSTSDKKEVDKIYEESLREGFEKVDLEMEDKIIHVSEEQKEPVPDTEMITPVSDELEAELTAPEEEPVDEMPAEETPMEEVPMDDGLGAEGDMGGEDIPMDDELDLEDAGDEDIEDEDEFDGEESLKNNKTGVTISEDIDPDLFVEKTDAIIKKVDDVLHKLDGNEEEPEAEEDEEDMVDYDVDDFEEKEFDELGEAYLKKVYENVNKFHTSSVSQEGDKLIIEGIISFNSGKDKATKFIFEAKDATKTGKVRFIGENAQISRGKKSFTLSGKISEGKFIAESLNYNYRVDSNRVYGTVRING